MDVCLKFIVLAEKNSMIYIYLDKVLAKLPSYWGGGVGVSKRQCRLVYISYRVSNSFDVESEILCAIEGPNWFHVVVIHPRFRRGLLGH